MRSYFLPLYSFCSNKAGIKIPEAEESVFNLSGGDRQAISIVIELYILSSDPLKNCRPFNVKKPNSFLRVKTDIQMLRIRGQLQVC